MKTAAAAAIWITAMFHDVLVFERVPWCGCKVSCIVTRLGTVHVCLGMGLGNALIHFLLFLGILYTYRNL